MAIYKGQDASRGTSNSPGAVSGNTPEKLFSQKSASQKFKIYNNAGDQFVAQRPFSYGLNDCRFSKLTETYNKNSIKIVNPQANNPQAENANSLALQYPDAKIYSSVIVKENVNTGFKRSSDINANLSDGSISYTFVDCAIRETKFSHYYLNDTDSNQHLDGRVFQTDTAFGHLSSLHLKTFESGTEYTHNYIAIPSRYMKISGIEQTIPTTESSGRIAFPDSASNINQRAFVYNTMIDSGTGHQVTNLLQRNPISGTKKVIESAYASIEPDPSLGNSPTGTPMFNGPRGSYTTQYDDVANPDSHGRWLFEDLNQFSNTDKQTHSRSRDRYYLTNTTLGRDEIYFVSDHASNVQAIASKTRGRAQPENDMTETSSDYVINQYANNFLFSQATASEVVDETQLTNNPSIVDELYAHGGFIHSQITDLYRFDSKHPQHSNLADNSLYSMSNMGINSHTYTTGQYYEIVSLGSLSQSDWNILAGTASSEHTHSKGASGVTVNHRNKVLISNVNGPEKTYAVGDVYRAACSPSDPFGSGTSNDKIGYGSLASYGVAGSSNPVINEPSRIQTPYTRSVGSSSNQWDVSPWVDCAGSDYDALVRPVYATSNLYKDVPVFRNSTTHYRIQINYPTLNAGEALALQNWAKNNIDLPNLNTPDFDFLNTPGESRNGNYVRAKDEFSKGRMIYQIGTPTCEDYYNRKPRITWSGIIKDIQFSITTLNNAAELSGNSSDGSYSVNFYIDVDQATGTFVADKSKTVSSETPGPSTMPLFEGMLFNRNNSEGRAVANPYKQNYNLGFERASVHHEYNQGVSEFEHDHTRYDSSELRSYFNDVTTRTEYINLFDNSYSGQFSKHNDELSYVESTTDLLTSYNIDDFTHAHAFKIAPEIVSNKSRGHGIDITSFYGNFNDSHLAPGDGNGQILNNVTRSAHRPSMGYPSYDPDDEGSIIVGMDKLLNYYSERPTIDPNLLSQDYIEKVEPESNITSATNYANDAWARKLSMNEDKINLQPKITDKNRTKNIQPLNIQIFYKGMDEQNVGNFTGAFGPYTVSPGANAAHDDNSKYPFDLPSGSGGGFINIFHKAEYETTAKLNEYWTYTGNPADLSYGTLINSTELYDGRDQTGDILRIFVNYEQLSTTQQLEAIAEGEINNWNLVIPGTTMTYTSQGNDNKPNENRVSNYRHAYKPFRVQYALDKPSTASNARWFPQSNLNEKNVGDSVYNSIRSEYVSNDFVRRIAAQYYTGQTSTSGMPDLAMTNIGFLCKYNMDVNNEIHNMCRIDVPYDTDDPSKFKISTTAFEGQVFADSHHGERGRVMFPGLSIIRSKVVGSSDRDDYVNVVAHTKVDSSFKGDNSIKVNVPEMEYYIEKPGSYIVTYSAIVYGYGGQEGYRADYKLNYSVADDGTGTLGEQNLPVVTVETAIV